MKHRLLLTPVFLWALALSAAAEPTPAARADLPPDDFGHALIPELLADPSMVEFDGVFYCYATTDGEGKHLSTSGLPVVWKSTDFLNWSFEGSLFPPGFKAKYWAPSTPLKHDGRYYLFPTLNGLITATVADKPTGPFRMLDGKDIYPNSGWKPFPIEQESSIDAEIFRVDDGAFDILVGAASDDIRQTARIRAPQS
jgi:hypothetical protein